MANERITTGTGSTTLRFNERGEMVPDDSDGAHIHPPRCGHENRTEGAVMVEEPRIFDLCPECWARVDRGKP